MSLWLKYLAVISVSSLLAAVASDARSANPVNEMMSGEPVVGGRVNVGLAVSAEMAPDLAPYLPDLAWDDILPVGIAPVDARAEHAYNGLFYFDQTLYFNGCWANVGKATASNYTVHMEVTGDGGGTWEWPGLTTEAGHYAFAAPIDIAVGPLSAGPHTFSISIDSTDAVAETDETNNYYERTIKVLAGGSCEISGCVWNDLDADGKHGAGEAGLAGWKVYLDENRNGQWDDAVCLPGGTTTTPAEPYQITDASGDYVFSGLKMGVYVVREVPWDGWQQTFPSISARSGIVYARPPSRTVSPENLVRIVANSPPTPPAGAIRPVAALSSTSDVILDEVPTSTWTYGCSATAAGMLFGYYDRHGYDDMYTGPCNGGMCPLTNLGQGADPANPIVGACSIIATQMDFDGRIKPGHVDDYWIGYMRTFPDPWVGNRAEHPWGDCVADFMGTSQWKWDYNRDGAKDAVLDGGTVFFIDPNGERTYDYVPPAYYGLPQTEGCHGLWLFAASRGYAPVDNFSQLIATGSHGGFTLDDFKGEIDAHRPVLIQLEGHSMLGVGYSKADSTIYVHDTWDNLTHSMTWGGSYAGMAQIAVTTIRLSPAQGRGVYTVSFYYDGESAAGIDFGNRVPPPRITATYPRAGSTLRHCRTYTIRWTSQGDCGVSVGIRLYRGSSLKRVPTHSTGNDGAWRWYVSRTLSAGDNYRIKISSVSKPSVCGWSRSFRIR